MIDFHRTNKNLHIILDCDDVLLDWISGFRKFVASYQITPAEDYPASWDMSEWLGVSADRATRLIEQFNNSYHFGRLDACADARYFVHSMKALGHRLTVLTSCSDDRDIVHRRKTNLQRIFGDVFQQIICLPLGESKSKWLGILERGVWVEDNYKNAKLGRDVGHVTFMIRRPHNRVFESAGDTIHWLDNLRPIVSLLT